MGPPNLSSPARLRQVIRYRGLFWVVFRMVYAIRGRLGCWTFQTPARGWPKTAPPLPGRFSVTCAVDAPESKQSLAQADAILSGDFLLFSRHRVPLSFPPNWFCDPFAEKRDADPALMRRHWSRIPDFGQSDIKCIWELSRFSWAYPLIRAFSETKDDRYATAFWALVEDWAAHNPPNRGVNWKCGQEISLRLFALVSGVTALAEAEATTGPRLALAAKIVLESAKRIAANIRYALRQNNNHGISEAAGLFTAGLATGHGPWIRAGRAHLERQCRRLIGEDGSFSQHSANYQRLMTDVMLWGHSGRTTKRRPSQ